MTDFAVKISFRNARILDAMRRRGIKSIQELADLAMASYTVVVQIVALKRTPIDEEGNWKDAAMGISSALDVEPEYLWPDHIKQIKLKTNSAKFEADLEEMARLRSMEETVSINTVRKFLPILNGRQQDIIRRRFGFDGPSEGYEDIGETFGVTRERVRQIEFKAVRILQRAMHRRGLSKDDFTGLDDTPKSQ